MNTTTHIDFDRAYRVDGYPGVAWWAVKFDTTHVWDDDMDDWDVVVDDTMLIMRMIGDDRDHIIDVDDIEPISDDDYCDGCGQIGCGWHS